MNARLVFVRLVVALAFFLGASSVLAQPETVKVTVKPNATAVKPGDQLVIAVVLDHAEGWHSHTNKPVIPPELEGFPAIPTEVRVVSSVGVTIGPVQWPHEEESLVDFGGTGAPVSYMVYGGRAIAYLPLLVNSDATQVSLDLTVQFQTCDDKQCMAPVLHDDPLAAHAIRVEVMANPPPAALDVDFGGFNASVFSDPSAFQRNQAVDQSTGKPPTGVVVLVLLATLGGLVLNLTPCVLPVIPIKVLTLSQHAGSPGRCLVLGIWMAAGVIAFWIGLGILAVSVTAFADPTRLFGYWWITGGIGLIIGIMGVGIMGAFQITLPQSVYRVQPKADTAWGSFIFGVMTAVLGLPCFGFVAGALLAGSATFPKLTVLLIFAGLGVGMALPYLILAARPSLVSRIPRTGPASELVKHVMGLLLLAAAAYFIGSGALAFIGERPGLQLATPWWGKVLHWWIVAAFAIAAGGWLGWRTIAITKKPVRRVVFGVIGGVVAAGAVIAAADMTRQAADDFWIPWSREAEAKALAEGRVVVIDFTAEWCLNCKTLKGAVLHREPLVSMLRGPGAAPLVADLTGVKAPGWARLNELGRTGIPTLAVLRPGDPEPWVANYYVAEDVVKAIGGK